MGTFVPRERAVRRVTGKQQWIGLVGWLAGRPVAAVSLMGPGIIYLTDTEPRERLLLATACAALLLRPTDL